MRKVFLFFRMSTKKSASRGIKAKTRSPMPITKHVPKLGLPFPRIGFVFVFSTRNARVDSDFFVFESL